MKGLPVATIAHVVEKYGYRFVACEAVMAGYRNISHVIVTDRGRVNLILYKHEAHIDELIQRTNRVGTYLAECELPVRAPRDDRVMRLTASQTTRYACLYNYLPGTTIAWEMYSMKHIKLLGWAMGDMHAALAHYRHDAPSVVDEYDAIIDHMTAYFAAGGVVTALHAKLGLVVDARQLTQMKRCLTALRDLPQQTLHMDFVRGNVLFDNDVTSTYQLGSVCLSGILDLEKTARGPVVMDIARTLAFLYVDCAAKPRAKIDKYFLVSGYNTRSAAHFEMTAHSLALLDQLVTMFLTYDLYKFLRDNPYESLARNHHFVRTRDMLITRKMLQYSR